MADPLSLGALQPVIARVTVAESVYQQMRESLVLGRFESGQMLTVGALAETFQTSPMPVREALRRLGAEGAVEIRSNGSAYVPDVTPESLADITRARLALEGLATELAVAHISDDEARALSALEEQHSATVGRREAHEMLKRNRDFHFAIYTAARSPVLLSLIESLWLRYGPFMRLLSEHIEPERASTTQEPFLQGHREIVTAICARDPARARKAMCRDIEATQRLLAELCAERMSRAG